MRNEINMLRLMNLNQNFVFPLLGSSQYLGVCYFVKVTIRMKNESSIKKNSR